MSAPERNVGGRPAIGGPVHVRLGGAIVGVDAHAERHGVNRAEATRRLVARGLDPQHVGDAPRRTLGDLARHGRGVLDRSDATEADLRAELEHIVRCAEAYADGY